MSPRAAIAPGLLGVTSPASVPCDARIVGNFLCVFAGTGSQDLRADLLVSGAYVTPHKSKAFGIGVTGARRLAKRISGDPLEIVADDAIVFVCQSSSTFRRLRVWDAFGADTVYSYNPAEFNHLSCPLWHNGKVWVVERTDPSSGTATLKSFNADLTGATNVSSQSFTGNFRDLVIFAGAAYLLKTSTIGGDPEAALKFPLDGSAPSVVSLPGSGGLISLDAMGRPSAIAGSEALMSSFWSPSFAGDLRRFASEAGHTQQVPGIVTATTSNVAIAANPARTRVVMYPIESSPGAADSVAAGIILATDYSECTALVTSEVPVHPTIGAKPVTLLPR